MRDEGRHRGGGRAQVSLHPAVYDAIIVLAAIFLIGAWGFFGAGYSALVLAVVTLFFVIAIGIPGELARLWRNHHDEAREPTAPPESLGHWLRGDVTIWRERMKGYQAAFETLLPIAAVAIGMVAFAIVHELAVG